MPMPRMHVLTGDGQWIPMADKPYENEDYLQKLLATHPERRARRTPSASGRGRRT